MKMCNLNELVDYLRVAELGRSITIIISDIDDKKFLVKRVR